MQESEWVHLEGQPWEEDEIQRKKRVSMALYPCRKGDGKGCNGKMGKNLIMNILF